MTSEFKPAWPRWPRCLSDWVRATGIDLSRLADSDVARILISVWGLQLNCRLNWPRALLAAARRRSERWPVNYLGTQVL